PGNGLDTFNIRRTNPTAPLSIQPSGGLDRVSIQTQFSNPAYVSFPSGFTYAQRLGDLSISPFGHAELAAGAGALAVDNFSLSHDSTIDLHDNDFVSYGSTLIGDVETFVSAARNAGLWNGTFGITSSDAKLNPNASTTLGVMSSDDYKLFHGA